MHMALDVLDVAELVEYVAHAVHAVTCPAVAVYDPAGHAVQLVVLVLVA